MHKAQVTACVRVPGERFERVEQFATTVRGLLVLGDWLKAHAVTHVVMEATGDYWQPIWHLLESDFELMLFNAPDVKQVPGRKTDVSDSVWLCRLAEAGLLRASFVPRKPIREPSAADALPAHPDRRAQARAQRLHKALEDTGIKLDCVATDILGKSGRAMLDALVAGTTDPELLAELARGKLRKMISAVRNVLEAASRRCTRCLSARSSPTSTSSTSRSTGSQTRSGSRSALSPQRLSCCARSPAVAQRTAE